MVFQDVITCIKEGINNAISIVYGIIFNVRWMFNKRRRAGLNTESREDEIIVSLTSFPDRIGIADRTVKSVLMQKYIRPDKIELWLACEQFPNKEKDLPEKLLKLRDFGLSICWCGDIKSYKKLIPALIEHPDSIIVTADDDVYYSPLWLKPLYQAYLGNENNIYCHKATQFLFSDEDFQIRSGGKYYYTFPSYANKLVGVGGVLYPPHALYRDVIESELYMKLAPTNDDIWFWIMGILNDHRVAVVDNNKPKPIGVFEWRRSIKLSDINDRGQMLFWEQFYNCLSYYPDLYDLIANG